MNGYVVIIAGQKKLEWMESPALLQLKCNFKVIAQMPKEEFTPFVKGWKLRGDRENVGNPYAL